MNPLALMVLAACPQSHVATLTPHGDLQVQTEHLEFPDTPLDLRGEAQLALTNVGQAALTVTLALTETEDAFSLAQDAVSLAPAETRQLALWFHPPADQEPHTQVVLITPSDGPARTVTISAAVDPDGDADGHEHPQLGGDDCDDTRADVSPSASETWYDGLDQDCDGASDDDADFDGWDVEPGGQDCDDGDPTVRPDALEVWYDGVDQDCDDASDFDADRDGADVEPTGDDCADDDPLVHPAATEVWYDGVDQDCDDASDLDADRDGQDAVSYGGQDCDDAHPLVYTAATESDDLQDEDCDGLVDEDYLVQGDLVLSEVLVNPAMTYDHYGQFIEVINVSDRDVDLTGWTLFGDGGDLVLHSQAVVGTGQPLLLCLSEDSLVNGGLACDGSWEGPLALSDSLQLSAGELTLDEVAWDELWPVVEGASLSLSPDAMDHQDNDESSAWCNATSTMSSGDLGTPGAPNDECL